MNKYRIYLQSGETAEVFAEYFYFEGTIQKNFETTDAIVFIAEGGVVAQFSFKNIYGFQKI